ncbi:MAG: hypothetical protein JWM39_867 [Parcubacteria group bacterium]|nr:hypothetical protein [Parcubacteria group bacterium]
MKIALLAALLLIGATAATAQTIPQPIIHKEATATATTKTPDGKVITQTSKVATDTPVAVPPAKPAPPAPKAQSAPPKPAATPTTAHRVHPYEQVVVGMKNNQDLANHIDASLAIDPTGNRPVNLAMCQPNGYSCGTPNILLRLALRSDPDRKGRLTLQNLSAFVRILVLAKDSDPPGSQRWMGCILRNTKQEKWDCMTRPYDPGEKVYVDPENMKPVIPLNCVNFIGDIVPENGCAYIYFSLHETDEVHVGPEQDNLKYSEDDVCRPAIQEPNDNEFRSALIFDQCPRVVCNNLGKWFSFKAPVSGIYILRLPKSVAYSDVVLDFCDLFADGTQTVPSQISKTAYTRRWRAYLDFPDKEMSKASRAEISWVGTVRTWELSDKRAFKGMRPAPDQPVGTPPK